MATVCGISVKEALLMPPGEVLDVFELYTRANGLQEKSNDD